MIFILICTYYVRILNNSGHLLDLADDIDPSV